jgi:hypothetical protein
VRRLLLLGVLPLETFDRLVDGIKIRHRPSPPLLGLAAVPGNVNRGEGRRCYRSHS